MRPASDLGDQSRLGATGVIERFEPGKAISLKIAGERLHVRRLMPSTIGWSSPSCLRDPIASDGTANVDAIAGMDLALPIRRQVIAILPDYPMASAESSYDLLIAKTRVSQRVIVTGNVAFPLTTVK
jgi:hypothetical protein